MRGLLSDIPSTGYFPEPSGAVYKSTVPRFKYINRHNRNSFAAKQTINAYRQPHTPCHDNQQYHSIATCTKYKHYKGEYAQDT